MFIDGKTYLLVTSFPSACADLSFLKEDQRMAIFHSEVSYCSGITSVFHSKNFFQSSIPLSNGERRQSYITQEIQQMLLVVKWLLN